MVEPMATQNSQNSKHTEFFTFVDGWSILSSTYPDGK